MMCRPRRRIVVLGTIAALAASLTVAQANAAPDSNRVADHRSAGTLTRATFADPPTSVRPKYRWWVPLAYTDDQELRAELDQMKAVGAGGAEVAPFGVDGTGNNTNPFSRSTASARRCGPRRSGPCWPAPRRTT